MRENGISDRFSFQDNDEWEDKFPYAVSVSLSQQSKPQNPTHIMASNARIP